MRLRNGLSKIGLAGFQVFDKYTEIPISRLTFLFGPNSAGKSSIEDALSVAARIWWQHSMAPDWMDDLERHWRRTGGLADASDYAPSVQIDVTIDGAFELDESFCMGTGRDLVSYNGESHMAQQLTLRATITRGEPSVYGLANIAHWGTTIKQREVLADGLPLFGYAPRGESYINFAHPLFRAIEPLENFQEAAKRFPEVFGFDNETVKFKASSGVELPYWRNFLRFQADSMLFSDKSESALALIFDGIGSSSALQARIELVPAIKEFAFFISLLEELVCAEATVLIADIVPASRKIPTEMDLTLWVEGGGDAEDFGISSLIGDQRYLAVATSFAHQELCSVIAESREADAEDPVGGLSIHERVNLYLTDYLFIERGFCLNFDYLVLLAPSVFKNITKSGVVEGDSQDPLQLPASLVRIRLADSLGRRFSFEEVGSGLGYVLPVLCSLARLSWRPVLIQQPELHLHPALQTAMGDVFIDASSHDYSSRVIVETHSEHLLLRVLKRVRQSSSGTQIPDQLRIASDEVTVLYFNPLPDGTSEVKHLRVSRDGDFMDRWPRGFFDERDRELFDE